MEQIDTTSLPQNLEAEQALLGAVLANNKAYEKFPNSCAPTTLPIRFTPRFSKSFPN